MALPPFRRVYPPLVGLTLAALSLVGRLNVLDDRWRDTLHRLRGMRPADSRVVLVVEDDQTAAVLGVKPSKKEFAAIIRALTKLKTKAIGIDYSFSTDKDSKELVDATREAGNVFYAAPPDPDSPINMNALLMPFPELRKVSAGVGAITSPADDGSSRLGTLMVSSYKDAYTAEQILKDRDRTPSLGTALVARFQGRNPDDIVREFGPEIRLDLAGQRDWEKDLGVVINGEHVFSQRTDHAFERLPMQRLIMGDLSDQEKARLNGGIALLGSVVKLDHDYYPSAFDPLTYGVEMHANVVDNLLNKRNLRTLPRAAELALLLGLALIPLGLAQRRPAVNGLAAATVVLGWLGASYLLFLHQLCIPVVGPLAAFSLVYVGLLVHQLELRVQLKPATA